MESVHTLAQELDQPSGLIGRALAVIQSLEPAGVGARNLSECLCLQLLRHVPVDQLALGIVQKHLEALAQHHYNQIAHDMGTDQREVRRAAALIRSLNPRPGSTFSAADDPVYIIPDIIVAQAGGRWEIMCNDRFLPSLCISSCYTHMLKETDDAGAKEYLTEKVRQAKWTIQAVEQRRNTLLTCAEGILSC